MSLLTSFNCEFIVNYLSTFMLEYFPFLMLYSTFFHTTLFCNTSIIFRKKSITRKSHITQNTLIGFFYIQSGYLNDFQCVVECFVSRLFLRILSNYLHLQGFSPVCDLTCIIRLLFLKKAWNLSYSLYLQGSHHYVIPCV